MNLHLDLDPTDGRLARQLARALRDAIQGGRLGPQTVLPPTRRMASDLGISRGPVIEAYEQLIAEGYLTARQGSGTRVAPHAPGAAPASSALMADLAATMAVPPQLPTPSDIRIDLRPILPDLALFPRTQWAEAYQRAARTAAHRELAYPPPAGVAALRTALAGHLRRVRDVRIPPGEVVVTAGQTQAVAAIARALQAAGHTTIAVEDPGDPREHQVLRSVGLHTVGVAVDSAGLDVAALRTTDARAVLVTPGHHYPSGVSMSPHRRADLVAWSRTVDGIIIEDDYDSELRFERRSIPALQSLAPERVVLAGSVTKTLAPALRLGWVVAPATLARAVVAERASTDFGSASLDQLALADLLASGAYSKHLRGAVAQYRLRRQALLAALAHHLPRASVRGAPIGLHVCLELAGVAAEENAIVRAAAGLGVAVCGIGPMRLDVAGPPALVLGYGQVSHRALTQAAAALAKAIGA